jgi:Cdc6-like AAA superfamily ATPase
VPVSIDFLSGLYNRHSCYADRLTVEQLEAIQVSTPVEAALRQWIKDKKDVVLTGNPGDGKTFLLRQLSEEINKAKGDQVLDATSEKDYSAIVNRWKQTRKTKRPFFLAINHGPLNRLLQLHAAGDPVLQEVKRQLDESLYYGNGVPKPPKGVVVLDLNLRSVLTRGIIEAALDNLLRDQNYGDSSFFSDDASDGTRNRRALVHTQVRERLVHRPVNPLLNYSSSVWLDGDETIWDG